MIDPHILSGFVTKFPRLNEYQHKQNLELRLCYIFYMHDTALTLSTIVGKKIVQKINGSSNTLTSQKGTKTPIRYQVVWTNFLEYITVYQHKWNLKLVETSQLWKKKYFSTWIRSYRKFINNYQVIPSNKIIRFNAINSINITFLRSTQSVSAV